MITKDVIAELRASAMRGNDITPLLCDVLMELLALPALAPPVETKPMQQSDEPRSRSFGVMNSPPYPSQRPDPTPDVRTIDPGARQIGLTEPPGGRPL